MKTSPRVALCACFASLAVGIVVAVGSKPTAVVQKTLRPRPAALMPTVPGLFTDELVD
jgi:hypothetical protein